MRERKSLRSCIIRKGVGEETVKQLRELANKNIRRVLLDQAKDPSSSASCISVTLPDVVSLCSAWLQTLIGVNCSSLVPSSGH